MLQQTPDDILTLITCTPPGTAWKRLIIQAKLQTYYDKQLDSTEKTTINPENEIISTSSNQGFIPGADTTLVARIANFVYRTSSFFQINTSSKSEIIHDDSL